MNLPLNSSGASSRSIATLLFSSFIFSTLSANRRNISISALKGI